MDILQQRFSSLFRNIEHINLSSGFSNLDNKGLFYTGNVNIIAGRPGMGVNILIYNLISSYLIKNQTPVVYISPTENRRQTVSSFLDFLTSSRFFYENTVFNPSFSKEPNQDKDNISKALYFKIYKLLMDFGKMPLQMHFSKAYTNLDNTFRLFNGNQFAFPRVLVLENFQKMYSEQIRGKQMSYSIDSRRKELQRLKEIAKQANLLVLIMNNIHEQVDFRKGHNKRPQLPDLVNLTPIPIQCDNVLLLYRPEYYQLSDMGHPNLTFPGRPLSSQGLMELSLFGKNDNWKTYLELDLESKKLKDYG